MTTPDAARRDPSTAAPAAPAAPAASTAPTAPAARRGSTLLVCSALLALVAASALALAARSAASWRTVGEQRLRDGVRLQAELAADRLAAGACADTAGVEAAEPVPAVRGVSAVRWWRGRRLPAGGCWWVVQVEVANGAGDRVAARRTVRWAE